MQWCTVNVSRLQEFAHQGLSRPAMAGRLLQTMLAEHGWAAVPGRQRAGSQWPPVRSKGVPGTQLAW